MKKTTAPSIIVFLSLLVISQFLFAGGAGLLAGKEGSCKEVSDYCKKNPSKCANSTLLAAKVQAQLHELEQKASAQGRDLKAVFIGRMGSDLGESIVLSNQNPETGESFTSLKDYRRFADDQESKRLEHLDDHEAKFLSDPEGALEKLASPHRKARYSHLGIALKNHPRGRWHITHLLRSCQNPVPNLYDQNITTFFLDEPHDFGSQIIIPKQKIQDRMEKFILKEKGAYFLMSPFYNLISEWNNSTEQSSTNWTLEVMATSQLPEGQFFDMLQERLDALDKDVFIDRDSFIKKYSHLKRNQNNLRNEWGIKYAGQNQKSTSTSQREELQEKIKRAELKLAPYYRVFSKGRKIAQEILKQTHYLPLRVLFKGVHSLAGTYIGKAFGPSYVRPRKDNNSLYSLGRVNITLSFREYSEKNNLLETDLLNGIVDIYLTSEERHTPVVDKTTKTSFKFKSKSE